MRAGVPAVGRRFGFCHECAEGTAGGQGHLHISRWLPGALHSGSGLQRPPFLWDVRSAEPPALAQGSRGHQVGPKTASSGQAPTGQNTGERSCCPGKFISTSGHPEAIG